MRQSASIENDRKTFLKGQAATFRSAHRGGSCPDCGNSEDIEDNGEKGSLRTFRCQECNCQWDRGFGREP